MKLLRTKWLAIFFAALTLACLTVSSARAKDTVSFAYLDDPSLEVVLWALKNGKVSSDLIDVQPTAMDIPAMLQATAARTYDVIMTAAMLLPRAMERGLDLRLIASQLRNSEKGRGSNIWVRKDSPIKSVQDLKGKKLAVQSLGSAGATLMRISLNKSDKINVNIPGGDINFVELPGPAMLGALTTGSVDAAQLIHLQAYQAGKSGDFVAIAETARNLYEVTNLLAVSAVLAGYQHKLDNKPDNYLEFLRVMRASRDYALANREEVFAAVASRYAIDPEYFEIWFEQNFTIPIEVSEQDKKALTMLWSEAQALGLLRSYPPIEQALWSRIADGN